VERRAGYARFAIRHINALSALATEVSNDSSAAHNEGDTIQATFNVSGAVDEDHRQLSVLADGDESGPSSTSTG